MRIARCVVESERPMGLNEVCSVTSPCNPMLSSLGEHLQTRNCLRRTHRVSVPVRLPTMPYTIISIQASGIEARTLSCDTRTYHDLPCYTTLWYTINVVFIESRAFTRCLLALGKDGQEDISSEQRKLLRDLAAERKR